MEPNIIKMYQERFTEFLHVLKNDIYPESVPFQTKFSCTDHPVPWSERLDLEYKEIKKGRRDFKSGANKGRFSRTGEKSRDWDH